MASCDINGSIAVANLMPNNAGIFKVWVAIYGKLCEINQQYDDMATCDINDAISRAGCCVDASPFKMLQAIYGKLCDVEDAIEGNAPVDCCECFRAEEGPPLWTPSAGCDLALHQNLLNGTFSYYDDRVGQQVWVDLIV
jgi:hypothetical protein